MPLLSSPLPPLPPVPPLSARLFVSASFRSTPESSHGAGSAVRYGTGMVGVDVRTGKMVGQKTFYVRKGAKISEVSADDIRRTAIRYDMLASNLGVAG